MATLTFELEQFSKGYFLAWIVTTQCWNKVEVTLKVGNTEYFFHFMAYINHCNSALSQFIYYIE